MLEKLALFDVLKSLPTVTPDESSINEYSWYIYVPTCDSEAIIAHINLKTKLKNKFWNVFIKNINP